MSDTTPLGEQIGSVVSLNGSVWAVSGTSHRPLSEGAPVYEGEEIVTESDSNVEIKFSDETILGQGEDSAVRLDDYAYSEDENNLDFHMVKGVMRVVSGEIVKVNPEAFNLSTPLATIGIRGTEIMVQVDNGREIIGVDQLGEGHTVVIANAFNEVVIDRAGMFSGVDFDGSLISPDEMPDNFINQMIQAAPLTLLGDTPRSPGDPQTVIPPDSFETIDNQTGEYKPGWGMEYAEEDEEAPPGAGNEEEYDLTEAEIEALLELETAAGGDSNAEELGEVVDITYDPADPEIATTEGQGVGGDLNSGSFGGPSTPDAPADVSTSPPPVNEPAPPPVTEPVPPVTDPAPPPAAEPPANEVETPLLADDAEAKQSSEEENLPVTYNVISEGDVDGEDTTLLAADLLEGSEHQGEVAFTSGGEITYTPDVGETGTVVIDYTVIDGDGDTASAQLSIELAEDSEPVITTTNTSGDETDGLVSTTGTFDIDYGADAAGSSYTLSAADATWDSENNTLQANDESWTIEVSDGAYSFTQEAAFAHTDTSDPNDPFVIDVSVTATDSDGSISSGSFSVTVDDDGPTADNLSLTQTAAGEDISYNVFSDGDASTGIDGGALAGAALSAGSDYTGTVSYDANGDIGYAPSDGETGTVTIDYTVTDSDSDSATAQMSIELADPEIAVNDYMDGGGGEVIIGGEGDDTLDGAQGRDVILGTGGDDELIGGNSKDVIFGGTGDDSIDGGKGNDSLAGEGGLDTLTGGQGNDTFVFASPDDGTDTILDFDGARDQIELYEATFDLLSDSQDHVVDNQFVVIDDATYSGGYDFDGATSGLIYASEADSNIGNLYYDPNDTINGDETLLASITEDGGDANLDAVDIDLT